MNLVEFGSWSIDWTWSLPLVMLNTVIHVLGLGFITTRAVHVLREPNRHRRLVSALAVGLGFTVLLATVLHWIEAAIWAIAYRLLGALPDSKGAMLYFAQRDDDVRSLQCIPGTGVAHDGRDRGAERDPLVRPDDGVPVRHDSKDLAPRELGMSRTESCWPCYSHSHGARRFRGPLCARDGSHLLAPVQVLTSPG